MDSKRKRKPREFTGVVRNDIRLKKLVEILCEKLSFLGEGVPVKERYIDLACKIYPEHKNSKEIDSKIRFLQAVFNENYKYAGATFDVKSINVLAVAAGYKSWRDFLNAYFPTNKELSAEVTQEESFPDNTLINDSAPTFNHHMFDDADDLEVSQNVIIGWCPDRYLKLKYLDDCKFEVCESTSPEHIVGSIIEARWFEVRLDECAEGVFGSQARIWACFRGYSEMLHV